MNAEAIYQDLGLLSTRPFGYDTVALVPSDVQELGLGLKARVDIECDSVIAIFTRELGSTDNTFPNYDILRGGKYYSPSTVQFEYGAFANDAFSEFGNNAGLMWNSELKAMVLTALRKILKGEDICTAYGSDYWSPKTKNDSNLLGLFEKYYGNKETPTKKRKTNEIEIYGPLWFNNSCAVDSIIRAFLYPLLTKNDCVKNDIQFWLQEQNFLNGRVRLGCMKNTLYSLIHCRRMGSASYETDSKLDSASRFKKTRENVKANR